MPKRDKASNLMRSLRRDDRNEETPFKAIIRESKAKRFATREQAITFYNSHDGRCLLSHNTNEKQTIIAYKYR